MKDNQMAHDATRRPGRSIFSAGPISIPFEQVDDTPQDRPQQSDRVNHPQHYTQHPSGVECIQITEHMNFCLGNAIKYIWRADMKGGVEDLRKAAWYIDREIERRARAKE